MTDLAKLVVRLEAESSRLTKELEKTNRQLNSWESKARKSANSVKTAFLALGAGIAALGIKNAIRDQIDLGDAISKMSQRTKASAEFLSRMAYAGELTDVSMQSVEKSIIRMQRSLSEAETGLKTQARAFDALGLSVSDLKQLRPEEQFLTLVDALKAVKNPADRVRYGTDIMGRGFTELQTVVDAGSDGLREMMAESDRLGKTFTQLEADQMAATNDAFTRFRTTVGAASKDISVYLGPTLQALAEFLADTLPKAAFRAAQGLTYARSSFTEWAGSIADFLGYDDVAAELKDMSQIYRAEAFNMEFETKKFSVALGDASRYSDIYNQSLQQSTETTRKAAAEAKRLADRINDQVAALQQQAATLGMTDAQIKIYELSSLGASAAQLNLARNALATIDAFNRQQELAEAARSVWEETRTPMENLNREYTRLNDLLAEGVIDWDTYARATLNAQDRFDALVDKTKETKNALDEFGKAAAQNMEKAFADFFFDPFQKGVDGMVDGFVTALRKMAAELAAQEFMRVLLGDFGSTGNIGGWVASAGKWLGIPGFATGGEFTVGGGGGTDSQLVAFRATPGEKVIVQTPGQQGGGMSMVNNWHIHANDSRSFLQQAATVEQEITRMVLRAMSSYNMQGSRG